MQVVVLTRLVAGDVNLDPQDVARHLEQQHSHMVIATADDGNYTGHDVVFKLDFFLISKQISGTLVVKRQVVTN
jgi:hypothetical protein